MIKTLMGSIRDYKRAAIATPIIVSGEVVMEVAIPFVTAQLIDAIQKGWAKKWRANGWMRNAKDPALNPDLWEKLLDLLEKHEVTFVWVKGHAGHPENERCDQLAVQESQKFKV